MSEADLPEGRLAEPAVAIPRVDELYDVDARISCPMCRARIAKGSRICINCKSDLTWRQHIGVSNTTLALLTALVTVLVTGADKVQGWLHPPPKHFVVPVPGKDLDDLTLLMTNTEPYPVVVERLELTFPPLVAAPANRVSIWPDENVVGPGTHEMRFRWKTEWGPDVRTPLISALNSESKLNGPAARLQYLLDHQCPSTIYLTSAGGRTVVLQYPLSCRFLISSDISNTETF